MLRKITRRLFKGTYQYKIVLVCAGAHWFRTGNISETIENLQKIDLQSTQKVTSYRNTFIKTKDDLDYAFSLVNVLGQMKDFELRVESPWISIYTNTKKDINKLVKLDESKVKYISEPSNTSLSANTVIMPKMDFDYRITLGKTTQPNIAFLEWASSSKKCKLTKSCIRDLGKARSWGGTHFYITGDNNLLLVKMHLGGCIAKIERIVKN